MKTYTIEEAINDMASSAGVAHGNGYCTWICSAHIGYQRRGYDDEYAEGGFTTHDEDWNTGIFDGEKYNPKDFDEWYDEQSWEEAPDKDDSEVKAMFNDYCSGVWADSANEDNYEPPADRNRRIAEEIFYSWEHEEAPDNVFICREKDIVIVLTDDEYNFISHMADDEGDHSYFENLCDGCTTKFVNDYNPDWDSEDNCGH